MKLPRLLSAAVIAAFVSTPLSAGVFTMGFSNGIPPQVTNTFFIGTPYVEHGMSAINPNPGVDAHFDIRSNVNGWTHMTGNHALSIHEGNDGSRVRFTHEDGLFNLLQLDIVGWGFNANPNPATTTLTFTSSAGGLLVLDPSTIGTVDFTVVSGFDNISFLQVDMPNPEVTCISVTLPNVPVNCPNPGIDQLMFETVETIPEPAPLAIFGLGIAGMIALRRRAGRR